MSGSGKSVALPAMLAARVFSTFYRMPPVKRLLWRGWYDFLARRYRDRQWTFMNYGYRPPHGTAPLALAAEDEADRSCIQLYHLVANAVDLTGREVLEVGSGRGGGASFVARHLHPRRMVGVDVSPLAVAYCRARHAVPALSFEVGNAERLGFATGSFDVMLNVESSHCYGDPQAFLREVRRVLRPDGDFLYADFRSRDELDAWRDMLLSSGLRLVVEHDITPGVVAALDADDARKRDLIATRVARPLRRAFGQFAGLRGTLLYDELRRGAVTYRMFVLRNSPAAAGADQVLSASMRVSPGSS
ncbi:MAG TPA: class I SAM-dependent methyltransferase [Burkholderiales bacterium]|nr:class I SAM-dependent methyltransferase [Burkholderiales bacterium]